MPAELPVVEQEGLDSPQAREVEYALILSQMIGIVKADPSELRLAIYEFARARLKTDTSWADEIERKQLSAALETAIQGVEKFSIRQDEQERLQLSAPSVQLGPGIWPTKAVPVSELAIHLASSASDEFPAYWRAEALPVGEVHTRTGLSRWVWFSIGILLFGLWRSQQSIRNERLYCRRWGI